MDTQAADRAGAHLVAYPVGCAVEAQEPRRAFPMGKGERLYGSCRDHRPQTSETPIIKSFSAVLLPKVRAVGLATPLPLASQETAPWQIPSSPVMSDPTQNRQNQAARAAVQAVS
jgi:hypothetical protein